LLEFSRSRAKDDKKRSDAEAHPSEQQNTQNSSPKEVRDNVIHADSQIATNNNPDKKAKVIAFSGGGIEVSIDVDRLMEKIEKIIDELKEIGLGRNLYLLDAEYNGDRGAVCLYFYDPEAHVLRYWCDKTGHRPYFLTDAPPDVISRSDIVKHRSFERLETVVKFDLLENRERILTKVVVRDPLAVRHLRDLIAKLSEGRYKRFSYYEADIKYHHNYIYDLQLTYGMPYELSGGEVRRMIVVDEAKLSEVARLLRSGSHLENKHFEELSHHFAELFETPGFSPKRVAIDIEVYTPSSGRIPSPDYAQYPIISVALSSSDGMNKVLLLSRRMTINEDNKKYVKELKDVDIEIFDEEHALILEVFKLLKGYPIVLTFNGDNFDLRYLHRRAHNLGIDEALIPIKVKKIKRSDGESEYRCSVAWARHIDLYKFFSNRSIQAYAFDGAYKEFTLDAVTKALLGYGKVELEEDVGNLDVVTLVRYNLKDAQLTLELTRFSNELVWRLILLLMRISKLGLEDLTRSAVSSWIKSMLYWEHRRRGILIPKKEDLAQLKGRKMTEATVKGKKYAGAIVIDPPQGVFFDVAVLDFASLYPSIMMRWNISYDTIDPLKEKCARIEEIRDEKNLLLHAVCMDRPGIVSQIVGLLRELRVKIYKKKAKDKNAPEDVRAWYDVVQRALKVYINASYGVFGAESFPMYAPSVAESVTAIGRRVITATIGKAQELGLKVLYGDTDSLFIWNPDPDKLEELRKWVESLFGLELELDKVYRFVAFALKKNYVGVTREGEIVIKGMVGKKRNTPQFVKEVFSDIVESLSKIDSPEKVVEVIPLIRERIYDAYIRLKYRVLSLDEVAFRVGLTKNLDEYEKTTPQHVKAALQLYRRGISVQKGDLITFVKVRGKEGVRHIQLAKISDIDSQKYIETLESTLEQLFTALGLTWEETTSA